MRQVRSTILSVLAVMAPYGAGAAAQTSAPDVFTLDTYLALEGVGSPALAPDGSAVVYARSWIDPTHDTHRSALWIVAADGSRDRFLLNGSSPRWSPDGDRLAFVACGTLGSDPGAREDCPDGAAQQIYVRIMAGDGAGTVTQVTRLTESVRSLSWSPDGEHIAFVAFEPADSVWRVRLPAVAGARWTPDPRVIDDVWYRRDRRGFLPPGHDQIYVVPATGGTPRKLTPDLYDHEDISGADDPEWSPDGRYIYFDGLTDPDADYRWTTGGYGHMETEIYRVEVATEAVTQLTDRRGTDRAPRVSPDGRWIAYTGVDSTAKSYVPDDVYIMAADGSSPRNLTADFDRSPGSLLWSPDASAIYFTAGSEGTEQLYRVGLDGVVRRVTEGDHTLRTYGVSRDGRTAVGVLSTPTLPEDVVLFDPRRPEPRRVTRVNDDVLGSISLGAVEEVRYTSAPGVEIQGWMVKPPDYNPGRRYPLILSIHGGPHSMYDVGFNAGFQHWAANGYLVLYVNPRGSTGYGGAFGNAIDKDYPGPDFDDLMAGVDHVIDTGLADPDRLYVQGCSGGGILTAWVIGHTDRFAAAAVRCPIIDWISFVGTVDGPYWYNWFRDYPWVDPSEHLRRSPLMYADDVTTPTLLMTGVNDLRTPIPQTEEFYQALKMERVPTVMIRMNGEWHGTSSKPSNWMRTQLYLMEWFERWGGTSER